MAPVAHRTTAFALVGTIPSISPPSSLVKSSSTLGSLDCLGLESHLNPEIILSMLSAVPIKVIAKLQSHVARAFAYLVAKQRVLNQNTLPHFHCNLPLLFRLSLALSILPMRAIAFHVSFRPISTRP